MCAIGGIVGLPRRFESDPDNLRRMSAAMAHRGPDGEGYHSDPSVELLHRRLSIVGVDNGRQPIYSEDGSIVAICNGEFFNHIERRSFLESRGHVFATDSDSEILVHLYEEFGERALFDHLQGQFAFSIWDSRRRVLIIGRDRLGIIPVFWTQQNHEFLFASEIRGLLAHRAMKAEADYRGLDQIFSLFALPSQRTCFRGVSAVRPGTYLKLDLSRGDARHTEVQYWDLEFPERGSEYDGTEEQLVDEFGDIFERAVRKRQIADVPVVSYLSGGVDSTTIAGVATKLADEPIRTFSIRIPTKGLDEARLAQAGAASIASPLTAITCNEATLAARFPDLIFAAEAPVIDTSAAALLCLSEHVRERGFKVALTGEGADEALAGYPWFKTERILGMLDHGTMRPSNLVRRFIWNAFSSKEPWKHGKAIQDLIGGPHAASGLYGLLTTGRARFYSERMWHGLAGQNAFADISLNLNTMKRWHPLNRSLYFGYKTLLPGNLLNFKGDRVAMENSVETRYPFLDEEFVQFCAKLHPRWKLRGLLRDKYLLRKYARQVIPPSMARRKKRMFRAPFVSTFLNNSPPYVRQLLSTESLRRSGYFDPQLVTREFKRRSQGGSALGRVIHDMNLTAVVTTQLWHHLFLSGDLCDLPSGIGQRQVTEVRAA